VSGVLTINVNQGVKASSSTWIISGTSTPLVINGNLEADNSIFKFIGDDDLNIPAVGYYKLELTPNGGSSPEYTILAGSLTTADYIYIGDGVNAVTVNASTSNAGFDIDGDFIITTGAEFYAPNSEEFSVGGNWQNNGSFIANFGKVMFDGNSTGLTVEPGDSNFYSLEFNNSNGGWTMTSNATTTNNFTIREAQQFIASSSIWIGVEGYFWNGVNGANTNWNSCTLYLKASSSDSYLINASTTGDYYPTLKIGADTQIRMWNSSSTVYNVDPAGSLYSMDHSNQDGDLYIWGNYTRNSGIDYWSYATDFDGVDLSGGNQRAASVYFANFASSTFSGADLQIIGLALATTTITSQSSGIYSFKFE